MRKIFSVSFPSLFPIFSYLPLSPIPIDLSSCNMIAPFFAFPFPFPGDQNPVPCRKHPLFNVLCVGDCPYSPYSPSLVVFSFPFQVTYTLVPRRFVSPYPPLFDSGADEVLVVACHMSEDKVLLASRTSPC